MPRLVRQVPRYSKHRASGQAVVTLSGQDFYLGPYGTKASKLEYDRLIVEWLAAGRRRLTEAADGQEISVAELLVAYKRHSEQYYRKNGKPTSEVAAVLAVIRIVKQYYAREPVNAFGPLKLQALQQAMIRAGWSRSTINRHTGRIVRMFSWGVKQEMIEAGVAQALREVGGLHKGRTEARESPPVLPVEDSVVNVTLEHLPEVVADMVRLQRLTGCRPEEVCQIRPCDIDTSGAVWAYRPESHKMQHKGRERVIFIGPRGQDLLRANLLREKSCHCFCPAESEKKRREAAHDVRVTSINYGNAPGTNRKNQPARKAGERYTTASYRRAIQRACDLAFKMPDKLRKGSADETLDQRADRLKQARRCPMARSRNPRRLISKRVSPSSCAARESRPFRTHRRAALRATRPK